MQDVPLALSFAFDSAGNSIPARIAMIAMTTSSSMRVNAVRGEAVRFMAVIRDTRCWAIGRTLRLPPPMVNGFFRRATDKGAGHVLMVAWRQPERVLGKAVLKAPLSGTPAGHPPPETSTATPAFPQPVKT